MIKINRKFINPLVGYLIVIVLVSLLILTNILYLHNSLNQEESALTNREVFDENVAFFNNDLDDYLDLFMLTQTNPYTESILIKRIKLDVRHAPLKINIIDNNFDYRDHYDNMPFIYEMMEKGKGYDHLNIQNQHYRVRFYFDEINDTLVIYFLNINDFVESEYFAMFRHKYTNVEFSIYDNNHRVIAENSVASLQPMSLIKYETKYGFQIEKYIEQSNRENIEASILFIVVLALLELFAIGLIIKRTVNLYEIEEKTKQMEKIFNSHTMELEKKEKLIVLLEEKLMVSRDVVKQLRQELETLLSQNFKSDLRYFDAERFATLGKLTFGMILSNFKPLEDMNVRLGNTQKYLNNMEERISSRNLNDSYFETMQNAYNEELRQIKDKNNKCLSHIEDYKELILDFEEKRIRKIDPYVFLTKIIESFDVSTQQVNTKIKIESTKGYQLKTYPSLLTQLVISLLSGIIKYSFRTLENGNIWIAIHDSKDHVILTVLDDGVRLSDTHDNEMKEHVEEWHFFETAINDLVSIHLKGNLEIDSRKLKGTEYNIKLPKDLLKKVTE